MEAPMKLYVDTNDELSSSILYGFTEKRKEDDIEYIRKDAFIEKACKWLKDNVNDYTDDGCGDTSFVLINDLIEHFKKYVEI